jgi:hypothetical protein
LKIHFGHLRNGPEVSQKNLNIGGTSAQIGLATEPNEYTPILPFFQWVPRSAAILRQSWAGQAGGTAAARRPSIFHFQKTAIPLQIRHFRLATISSDTDYPQ